MHSRREVLSRGMTLACLMAGAGLVPGAAWAQDAAGYQRGAFDAKTMAELMKAMGGSEPVESKEVMLQAPDIAENGAVVPVGASTAAAGVKRLLILVEKNPNILSAMFDISEGIEPSVSTRLKMGQTSTVYAVAMLADGRALFAQKEVKVTLGGCGG